MRLHQSVSTIALLFLAFVGKSQSRIPIHPFGYDPAAYEVVNLYYTRTGAGDTTLFFIHGWNLDHTYWKEQVALFSKDYTVIALDLAGHGKSGKNRLHWTVESFSKDIIGIIQKEKLRRVILVAHSMGGEIALEVATSIPQTIVGIIGVDNLKDAALTITEEHRKGVDAYTQEFIRNYPQRAEVMARENLVTTDKAIVERIVQDYRQADPEIAVAILMNLFPKAAQAKDKLPTLTFPLKIIMSDYAPYQEDAFKKYCKNGYQIITIAHSGHFPMVEQPLPFNKALATFLQNK